MKQSDLFSPPKFFHGVFPRCKRQAVADIIPNVFNQMIAFVQSAEVERFADRFYSNPDSQYITIIASPDDEAVEVNYGKEYFDS